MDLKNKEILDFASLHLNDESDEPMYAENEKGEPDKTKPCNMVIYSPGSRQYANASARRNNRNFERLRSNKKQNQSADEQRRESAEFLADCTHSAENFIYDGKVPASREEFIALYSNLKIGYIADQVAKFGAEYANFKKKSESS